MPVHNESIKIAATRLFLPIFVIYLGIVFLITWIYNSPSSDSYLGIILIYIVSFGFGCIITFYNEKKLFSKLMEKEKEAYTESFITETVDNQKSGTEIFCYIPIDIFPDYIQTQYDYYIKKTLLSQRLASSFLITLAGGILLDITLNAINAPNIFRTFILIISLSAFSTLFLFIAILKHAEYNAGCAIYRNAILGVNLCKKKMGNNTGLTKADLAKEIGTTLQNLRGGCKKSNCKLKPEFSLDGWRTVELLELLGYVKIK
jgi:hypothetical protein